MRRFLSIGALLSGITALLALVLVSTFTMSALSAYQRAEQARMALAIVNGTRNIMSPMMAIRGETAVANLVLEAEAAPAATVPTLRTLHAAASAQTSSYPIHVL